jgi:hypothetical protein
MTTLSEAFAAQAASDFTAYTALTLANPPLPRCHRLHYLQMWLEKLCKAYLWLPQAAAQAELRTRHNVVAKVLPVLIRQHWAQIGFTTPRPELDYIRYLCREIDLLHPQIDDAGRRPDNVEYPWPVGPTDAKVPATWPFRITERMESNTGRLLLKAAEHLTRTPKVFLK